MAFFIIAAVLSASASTTRSGPAQTTVRVITDETTRKSCHYLGFVTVRKTGGRNKPGGALKKALDQTAKMRGNGLFLINQSDNWLEGASVSGEALQCPNGTLP